MDIQDDRNVLQCSICRKLFCLTNFLSKTVMHPISYIDMKMTEDTSFSLSVFMNGRCYSRVHGLILLTVCSSAYVSAALDKVVQMLEGTRLCL